MLGGGAEELDDWHHLRPADCVHRAREVASVPDDEPVSEVVEDCARTIFVQKRDAFTQFDDVALAARTGVGSTTAVVDDRVKVVPIC